VQDGHASPEQVARAEEIIRADFRSSLNEHLRQRGVTRPESSDDKAIYGFAEAATRRYHDATGYDPSLPRLSTVQLWEIRQRLYALHGHLGPLGDLLAIEGVEDIHIHGTQGGFLVFADHREDLPPRFRTDEELTEMVRHYAELAGRRFDPSKPFVTVILRDGSRLNAVMAPLSKPQMITVRKQQLKRFPSLRNLVEVGALPARLLPLLEAAVLARLNILISGGTGAGKTTLARVLALLIPGGERTCVLESETELWLHELRPRDCFSFEAREANVEEAGRITLTELFQQAALRQRPDRVIVGEVRGEEAMDMLHAMTSGHDGSLTTIHASRPRDALNRLEALATMRDANLAPRVVRQMVSTGVDLVIHLSSYRQGGDRVRRVASMAFVDENVEDSDGQPGVFEFCRYRVINDDWEIDDQWGLQPPRKVEQKLLMAGLHPADLHTGEPRP
jgi:pilus assembly protein CpaF